MLITSHSCCLRLNTRSLHDDFVLRSKVFDSLVWNDLSFGLDQCQCFLICDIYDSEGVRLIASSRITSLPGCLIEPKYLQGVLP